MYVCGVGCRLSKGSLEEAGRGVVIGLMLASSEQKLWPPLALQYKSHKPTHTPATSPTTGWTVCFVYPGIVAAVSLRVRLQFPFPSPASSPTRLAAFQHRPWACFPFSRYVGWEYVCTRTLRTLLNSPCSCPWLLPPRSPASHAFPSSLSPPSFLPPSPSPHPHRRLSKKRRRCVSSSSASTTPARRQF